MLKIRLQRIGRRNQPYYRIVATDSKFGPKSGRFIEILGTYDPKAGKVEIKKDRVLHWIENGAQTSGTVHNFLIDQKVIKGEKINVLPQKTPVKKEGEEEVEATPAAETPTEETPAEAPAEEAPVEAAPETEEKPAKEETPAEEVKDETSEEATPAAEETPAEEAKEEAAE